MSKDAEVIVRQGILWLIRVGHNSKVGPIRLSMSIDLCGDFFILHQKMLEIKVESTSYILIDFLWLQNDLRGHKLLLMNGLTHLECKYLKQVPTSTIMMQIFLSQPYIASSMLDLFIYLTTKVFSAPLDPKEN